MRTCLDETGPYDGGHYPTMKTIPLTALLLAMATGALAEIRTWTSADDASKTFEGELVSAAKGSITIKRKDGKSLTVPEIKLSQADRDFVAAGQEKLAAAEKSKGAAAKLKTSPMGAGLSGKVVKLEGKSLKKHDIFATKAPEYYLLYWGASW